MNLLPLIETSYPVLKIKEISMYLIKAGGETMIGSKCLSNNNNLTVQHKFTMRILTTRDLTPEDNNSIGTLPFFHSTVLINSYHHNNNLQIQRDSSLQIHLNSIWHKIRPLEVERRNSTRWKRATRTTVTRHRCH